MLRSFLNREKRDKGKASIRDTQHNQPGPSSPPNRNERTERGHLPSTRFTSDQRSSTSARLDRSKLLALIIPYVDHSTLLALTLVDGQTNSVASPKLHETIRLHSPRAYVSFAQRCQTRFTPNCKPRHLDLLLDVEFANDSEFAKLCSSTSNSANAANAGGKGWTSDIETVHLTTRGGPCMVVITPTRVGLSKREEGYWLLDLVKLWIERLAPTRGPKHFRWKHVDDYTDLSIGHSTSTKTPRSPPSFAKVCEDDGSFNGGFPNEKRGMDTPQLPPYSDPYPHETKAETETEAETPFPPFRWIFNFLSDWTSALSIDLPMTSEPISEGFRLSNLELQGLRFLSVAGTTVTRPLLAGILWEVTKGRRSKKHKKMILHVREPVASEMGEGLSKLMEEEDQELLQVVIGPYKTISAEDWREDVIRRYRDL